MRRLGFALASFALLVPAQAQTGPDAPAPAEAPVAADSACGVFARALEEARRAGSAQRLAGLHHFLMTRRFLDAEGAPVGERRFLMTYEVSLDEEQGELRLEVVVLPEAVPFQIEIGYAVGFDGRLRRMRARAGEDVDADLAGGVLRVRFPGPSADAPRVVEHPWDDAVLPKIVGAFLLPMLHEHGVPERVVLRDLNPAGTLTGPLALRRLPAAAAPLEASLGPLIAYGTDEGRANPTTRLFVAAGGARRGLLVHFETDTEVDAEGVVRHVAVSERVEAAEYGRLLPRWQELHSPAEPR